MSLFAEKLATLPKTIALASRSDQAELARRLRDGAGRRCVSVGSGGSMVAAHFLARCRGTLDLGHTTVVTPMELVLGDVGIRGADVWLFSAGASNPDIEAAHRHCLSNGCDSVTLVTTRQGGRTAAGVDAEDHGAVFVVPVADPKDGFLATHSLVASITALLLAANGVRAAPPPDVMPAFATGASRTLAEESEQRAGVSGFLPGDTLLLLHDPQVATLASLVETSLWETGIAPVQRVDFRNFAHGRHVWLARHPERTFVLAVTARESREIWAGISSAFPPEVRRGTLDLGNAGRLGTAISVVAGLAVIDELGRRAGIDPARPGRGDFAPAIYEHDGLLDLVERSTPAVVHKRSANLRIDPVADLGACLLTAGGGRRGALEGGRFGALVLDYDGTIVSTERRLAPPDAPILDELLRLLDGGIRLGIATGRGGSAGDALRSALPARAHGQVLMGYYNGAHLLQLSMPVESEPPASDPDIAELAEWLAGSDLVRSRRTKAGPCQITIDCDALDAGAVASELGRHPAVRSGRLRLLRSQHSLDVVAAGTSKLRVVAALSALPDGVASDVLAIGDSGSPDGNDHELLSGPMSVSVDQVCGDPAGCWTLFGDGVTGPDALHRILGAIVVEAGRGRLDPHLLDPDRRP